MKIMHLLPALSSGGVEQVVLELCQGLTARDVECVVVSAGGRMAPMIEQTGAKHCTHPLEKKNLRLLPEIFALAKLLREEKPDIVHVHSRIPGWVFYFANKLLPPGLRPILISSFHGVYTVGAYSRIMTHGTAVIAVSRFIRQHILDHYRQVREESIRVIPNSINSFEYNHEFCPDPKWMNRWREEHPEVANQFVLCLPARITWWKGHELLPDIVNILRKEGIPAHVLIVGEVKKGKLKYKERLEELYRATNIAEHVSWLGHRTDLREIFCISDVVLSLSLDPESFGKTTLEALALGRPVAGFDHGGVGEQLEEYLPEGRVAVGNATEMADLLARWHKNPPHLIKPVGSPYLREDMIRAHLELYKQLLNTP